MSFEEQSLIADLAEEEGGWLSAEEMVRQMHKKDQNMHEVSSTQVKLMMV